MIKLRHTPQMTEVRMTGDSDDFERLYDALHRIVGTDVIIAVKILDNTV